MLNFLFLMIIISFQSLTFQKSFGMEYASSFFATEASIKETVAYGLAHQILPSIQSRETINTKSQRPVLPMPQGYYEISIEGKPIRENNREGQEIVIDDRDDRRTHVLQTDQWPNSVHGVVYITFRNNTCAWGSGTLISTHLVLTAAHNLYETEISSDGRPIGRAREVKFYPAKNGREIPFQEQSVRCFYYPQEYTQDKSEDYGLLVLNNPVGERTGYFGLSILHPDQVGMLNVNVTGYPADKVRGRSNIHEMWGMGGKPNRVDQNFIEYDEIDTSGGQSGSGIWYQDGENYFVTGVHVLGGHPNKGTLLTKTRYEKIRTWANDYIQNFIIYSIREGKFQNIDYVDLNYKYIGDFGVNTLCDYAKNLKKVDLCGNSISDNVCQVLVQHPTIIDLNLSYNNITSRGAIELAQSHRILSLNVSYNSIYDDGAVELLNNKTLKSLDLSRNRILEIRKIFIALAQNTNLETLNIYEPYVPSSVNPFNQGEGASPTERAVGGGSGGLIGGALGFSAVTAGGAVIAATGGLALPFVALGTIVGGGTATLTGTYIGQVAGDSVAGKLARNQKHKITDEIVELINGNQTITSINITDSFFNINAPGFLINNSSGNSALQDLLIRNRNLS